MDLSDKYLKLIGNRKLYPPLNGYSAFLQGSEYNISRYYDKWYEGKMRLDQFTHMKEGFSQIWLPEDDFKFAAGFVFHEYLTNKKLFERRASYIIDSIKEIDKIYAEFTYKKIKETEWKTLFALIDQIRDIIWDVNSAVAFTILMDRELCLELLKKEKYPLIEQELNLIWDRAVEPTFESFDKSQLHDILSQFKEKNDWNKIVENCQYFLTDYHSARTLAQVEKAIKERYAIYIGDSKTIARALLSETKETNVKIEHHKKWLEILTEKERVVAHYLQLIMKIRDRRKNLFAKGMTIMYRIAEKMFVEVGVDRASIPFYTVRELLKGVEYLKLNKQLLIDRKKGFQWLVPCDGEPQGSNTNIDAGVERINTYFKECHTSKGADGTLKGQSAFKGFVKGTARIIVDINSKYTFNLGDILVAGMTRPEYVPLMRKASAIVTDEGGITCHAAIISRELKIPCVVGTKIATKVFKDGDMVEVDAEKGIVKILEKVK